MTEKPIMIMACGKVSGFNKIMFLMGVFPLKKHSFTTAAFKLMFQLLIFGHLCCHLWISLIQRLLVCSLQIMMISRLDQSSLFKFWLTFTWTLLKKNNVLQSMSKYGRPESSQEVGMPKNRVCWWVEIYQAVARWRPLVDGFGKSIKLWNRTYECEDYLKFSKKESGFLGYRWFDGYIALRLKAMNSGEGVLFGTKGR